MSLGGAFRALGMTFRIAGVVVTALGLRRTWRAFPPGERFLEPLIMPSRRFVHRAVEQWRARIDRWRHRPHNVRVEPGAMAFGTAFGVARVEVEYGSLPPGAPHESIAALDSRTREIQDRVRRLEASVTDLRDAAEERDGTTSRRLDELERRDVRVATEGVRKAALGLFLIGLGEAFELVAATLG